MTSKKYLGLDVGERIIGLAFGDLDSKLVFPRKALDLKQVDGKKVLHKMLVDDNLSGFVVGWPQNSDGSKSLQCAKIEKFVNNLKLPKHFEVHYINEYASSLEAQSRFRAFGVKKVDRETIDSTAAIIILESFFNKC